MIAIVDGRLGHAELDIPRYYDLLHGSEKKQEKTAEEVKAGILAEYRRLGGAKN